MQVRDKETSLSEVTNTLSQELAKKQDLELKMTQAAQTYEQTIQDLHKAVKDAKMDTARQQQLVAVLDLKQKETQQDLVNA